MAAQRALAMHSRKATAATVTRAASHTMELLAVAAGATAVEEDTVEEAAVTTVHPAAAEVRGSVDSLQKNSSTFLCAAHLTRVILCRSIVCRIQCSPDSGPLLCVPYVTYTSRLRRWLR